jgi:hypothetical protein
VLNNKSLQLIEIDLDDGEGMKKGDGDVEAIGDLL